MVFSEGCKPSFRFESGEGSLIAAAFTIQCIEVYNLKIGKEPPSSKVKKTLKIKNLSPILNLYAL